MTQPRILIVFHTRHGQTAKVADRMAEVLREKGAAAETHFAEVAPGPEAYDAVVIGDALTMARYSRPVREYVRRHATELNHKPAALFQLSMTSVNPDARHTEQAQQAMERFLADTGFRPARTMLLAGALPYTHYGWFTRHVMRQIVKREGGDIDTSRDFEYTDWQQVDAFASEVADSVSGPTSSRMPTTRGG